MNSRSSVSIKIYHIVHLDKLPSIMEAGGLLCDAVISSRQEPFGTAIGLQHIKARRMTNPVAACVDLMVGQCVPFYFCPRSVMLYLIHKGNAELSYRGGQAPIVHLVADMSRAIGWAVQNHRQWAFTTGNAGARYFESYNDLAYLDRIDWRAVNATQWAGCKEGKQAEFLVEGYFPWGLVDEIGVYSTQEQQLVRRMVGNGPLSPRITVRREWYY